MAVLAFPGACATPEPEATRIVEKPAAGALVDDTGDKTDRLAGYYYPEVTSHEIYKARAKTFKEATRSTRLGFVTAMTKQQLERDYSPKTAIFAKGGQADKLIIVGIEAGAISTIYQGRGLLAQLTAVARLSPLFTRMGVQEYFTFFDLAKLLGFRDITISDGVTWTHKVRIR
jgi:hypothetical protein